VQVNILYPDQKYGPEKKEVNEGVTKSSSMKDKKKSRDDGKKTFKPLYICYLIETI
jgi:hypothetical protein